MKKLAIWGLWHVHAGHFAELAKKYGELVGVWDENKERLNEFCREYDTYAYSSLEEMLSSDAEGVIVCTATSEHKDTILTLCKAGKHIFTEKVLAITNEDCDVITDAVKKSGLHFAICLPNAFYSGVQTVKEIIASGELGKVNSVRFKYSHRGASEDSMPEHFYNRRECGGGALIDHGVHGLHVIYYLCGMPEKFKSLITCATSNENALKKNTDRVEDASVAIMSYSNGCIAINECSSVTQGPLTLEVNGELGMCLYTCDRVMKITDSTNGELITVDVLPGMFHPLKQFVLEDIHPACGIDAARDLSYMVNELYNN